MHDATSSSLTGRLTALFSVVITLLLGACASYDGRLNSTSTKYLGTDGSIVIKTSTASLADRVS